MSDVEFVDGLIAKAPNPKAPEFVKASLSLKRVDLIKWLQGREGDWINVDVKEAKSGKWYCSVSTFKPSGDSSEPRQDANRAQRPATENNSFDDETIPF